MEKREKIIRLVVTEDEHAKMKAAADSDGRPLAAWVRFVALKKAEQADET